MKKIVMTMVALLTMTAAVAQDNNSENRQRPEFKKPTPEEMTNRMGFLSKHPTTQKPIPSPFINIGINYMNQAVRLWNEIFQIVKENCSTDYGEVSPQDDLMERLLRARKG